MPEIGTKIEACRYIPRITDYKFETGFHEWDSYQSQILKITDKETAYIEVCM